MLSWVSTVNSPSRHFVPAGPRSRPSGQAPEREAEGERMHDESLQLRSAPGRRTNAASAECRCELSASGRRGWLASCECQDACSWLGPPVKCVHHQLPGPAATRAATWLDAVRAQRQSLSENERDGNRYAAFGTMESGNSGTVEPWLPNLGSRSDRIGPPSHGDVVLRGACGCLIEEPSSPACAWSVQYPSRFTTVHDETRCLDASNRREG